MLREEREMELILEEDLIRELKAWSAELWEELILQKFEEVSKILSNDLHDLNDLNDLNDLFDLFDGDGWSIVDRP
jgi:hypothetical protein